MTVKELIERLSECNPESRVAKGLEWGPDWVEEMDAAGQVTVFISLPLGPARPGELDGQVFQMRRD
jgi:hypothetical protein